MSPALAPLEVRHYVSSLRSPRKRAYAQRYYIEVICNGLAAPDRGELSFMAAQAVQMRLAEIVKGSAS